MTAFDIVALTDPDAIGALLGAHWGADFLVSRGRRIAAGDLGGAAARRGSDIVGFITWRLDGDEMEIASLNSFISGIGIGSALLAHAFAKAHTLGLGRVWLTTTNDNVEALKFYQKRGMRLCALFPDVFEQSRRIKPQIPEIGNFGIPIRDELVLEKRLS